MTDQQDNERDPNAPYVEGNDPTQETDPAALTPEQEANRDSENATQGDQGPAVREQTAAPTGPGTVTSSDPNTPVAQSPPPPDAQSGVPPLTDGSNEGVEPQPEFAGDVPPGQPAEGGAAEGEEGEGAE